MNIFRFQLILLLLTSVQGCSVTGGIFDFYSSFTDLSYPNTFTIAYTYTWLASGGGPCPFDDSFTDLQTIVAGGTSYYASPAIITSQDTPVTYTHHFNDLTMTTESWIGGIVGGGNNAIVLPSPTPPTPPGATSTSEVPSITTPFETSTTAPRISFSITSTTSTTSSISTTSSPASTSNSLTSAAIGGIVGGILGGFLVLAGLLFWYTRRLHRAAAPPPPPINWVQQPDKPRSEEEISGGRVDFPQRSTLQYPETDIMEMAGGRVQGDEITS